MWKVHRYQEALFDQHKIKEKQNINQSFMMMQKVKEKQISNSPNSSVFKLQHPPNLILAPPALVFVLSLLIDHDILLTRQNG